MKKKIIVILVGVLLALQLCLLAACTGDKTFPRTFIVNFETNVDGTVMESVVVREGYRINGIKVPENPQTAIFRGWYTDAAFTDAWDIDTYRVTGDMTLYARWSLVTEEPTELILGTDAFTRTISWVQKDITSSDEISVSYIKGEVNDKVISPTGAPVIEYGGEAQPLEGRLDLTLAGGGELSYVADEALAGGYYKIIVTTNKEGVAVKEFDDLRFKGTGTADDPYLVCNQADLLYLTTNSFGEGTVAVLEENITIASVYAEKKNCVFNGLFYGTYDPAKDDEGENGKTITIKNNSGLFYEIGEQGEVRNLRFAGALAGSDPSIGTVANYNGGYIHDVASVAVSLNSGGGTVNDYSSVASGGVGGIAGTNKATGVITACRVTSAQDNVVMGKIAVGGIVGVNYGTVTDMTCSAIVGAYNGKEISSAISNSFAGTAVGVNYGTVRRVNVDGKINCRRFNEGSEGEGATNVGGVVGYNATGATIEECLFQGMRCVGDTNVGGIAGYNDGTIFSCFTGRRVRAPSGTTLAERKFVSPVVGTYNVGGIAGKCGEHSHITNVFSTANVWSYGMQGYTVAERADNSIGITCNQQQRTATNYLGHTYGAVPTERLVAPEGENNVVIDNSDRVGSVEHNLLGAKLEGGVNVRDNGLVVQYLTLLGDKFGWNNTYGISLLWQSVNTKGIEYFL